MQQVAAHHPHRLPHLTFAGIALAVYTAAIALAGQLPSLERPSAVAVGVTLDMMVLVPAAFYLLVVRRRGWPLVTLAPVLLLSLVAAMQILPADHQQPLRVFEAVLIPFELGLVTWVGWRAATAIRRARRDDATAEPHEQLHAAAYELLRSDRAAAAVATELAMFYYGLGAWRARPHTVASAESFSHHRRSGHAGILAALLLVVAVECVAAHILISMWSTTLAWLFTLAGIYSGLWLVADYRATVLRPVLVSEDAVHARAGLRWTVRLPRTQIVAVSRDQPDLPKETLNLTLLGTPSHWLTLAEPVEATGPYGLRRQVRAIGLLPDAGEEFTAALG